MPRFAFTIEDGGRGRTFRLVVSGQVDAASAEDLRHELHHVMGHTGERVVDLTRVEFIDSAALAVLLRAKKYDDALRLIGSPEVAHVFNVAGASQFLA